MTQQDSKQLVLRSTLATMINMLPDRSWDGLIQFAPVFHVDIEDETMFAIPINERIMSAAEELKKEGAIWPKADFEKMNSMIASKIPELK